jgi:uncharacterized protein YndB with AHSA1/START domain
MRVFEALVDAEHYPSWLVGARQVSVNDPTWPAPGSTFDHEVGAGPVDVHDSTTVVDLDWRRRLDLVVRARPFLVADVRFDLRPDGAGTHLRMEERPRGVFRLLSPLITPLVRIRNDRSLANLSRWLVEEVGGTLEGRET